MSVFFFLNSESQGFFLQMSGKFLPEFISDQTLVIDNVINLGHKNTLLLTLSCNSIFSWDGGIMKFY